MTALLVANLAPLMFGALVVFLLLGYPVAFSLAANGLFFGIIAATYVAALLLYSAALKHVVIGRRRSKHGPSGPSAPLTRPVSPHAARDG